MKKPLVLIAALLLPLIGVIIFRFYSESHFTVKVYYQEDLPEGLDCEHVTVPYRVDSTISWAAMNSDPIKPFLTPHFKIIAFSNKKEISQAEMNRIGDAFYQESNIDIYWLKDSLSTERSEIPGATNVTLIPTSDTSLNKLMECTFLFDESEDNAVLVDDVNRIRGFYNLIKNEEVDSLIIETKILVREQELGQDVRVE